ncbi:MAG: LysR family transcriptional regulator [Coriobacteriales bacterium]|jgi:DNA-binding transcriptional LysR family regulator
MELRNIKTFLKVAELGQLAAAAHELGYAQSTVTMQLQQLEKELGFSLFVRGRGSVELTEFGRRILPLATDMHNLEMEMGTIGRADEELSGRLRVGVIESLFYSDLIGAVARFSKQFPRVALEFRTDSAAALHKLLTENQVDVIVSFSRLLDSAYIDVMSSCDVRVVFATTADNPFSGRSGVSAEDIAGQQLFLTERESVYHQALEKRFQSEHIVPSRVYHVGSSHAIKELVKKTGGVCYLPEYAVAHELRNGELSVLDTAFETSNVQVIVAQRKEKWHSPQLHGLIEALEDMAWL